MTEQKKCVECGTPVEATFAKRSYEKYGAVNCAACIKKIEADEPLESEKAPHSETVDGTPPTVRTDEAHDVEILPPISNRGIVRPAISAHDAIAAWTEFQRLKSAILSQSDVMKIQNKNYTKKSGWRKFATFYNLNDRITDESRVAVDGVFIWKIKVECTAPNGRITEGVAMCSSAEKSGVRIEHDTYTTAHTRAKNRAISDMIAAGEVSAEEMR